MHCLTLKLAAAAVVLLAGCPARDKQSSALTPVGVGSDAASTGAHVVQDASLPPQEGTSPPPACDAGADCTRRGEQAFDAKRYLEAHQFFDRACELNDALGCKWFALELNDANYPRISVDPARVAPVMQKACDLGEMQACWMLGNGYLYGRRTGVVTPDPVRAVKLYQRGCDGGDAGSCASLADCYESGEGVAKDKALARKYRKRAAELGYVGE